MSKSFRTGACIAVATFAALAGGPVARAQPQAGPPPVGDPAPAADAAASERDKQEAQDHFSKGFELMGQQAWAAALAEFSVSRRLYPTRNATFNAATCMNRLQRFDEALDMFEALLREFPRLPAGDKAEALSAIESLRGRVGTLEITGGLPGARIVIDGRERGDYPSVDPIRVASGTHTVRLFKDGFAPFETRTEVAGGQRATVPVKLLQVTDVGRLRVTEQTGKAVDVVIDGLVVGVTPWEGELAVGDHMVVLRGEGNIGTAPVGAPIQARQRSTLALRAEELDALLHIDPTPAGATVTIDAVSVGRGTWEGALRAGAHQIEVRYPGYTTVKRQINLSRGQQERLAITVERDADADVWKKPAKIAFDVNTGFAVVPSLGGGVAGGCTDSCNRTIGIGGLGLFHAGYELGSGVGFGGTLGYLTVVQRAEGRASTITPVGLPDKNVTVNDALWMNTFVVGATVGYHFGESVPVSLRVGVGAALGSVRDARSQTVQPSEAVQPSDSVQPYPVAESSFATYVYLDPEVSISKKLGDRFEIGVAVQALILFALSQPTMDKEKVLWTKQPNDGFFTYPADALTGSTVLVLVPGVNARYAF